jgi:hypothetical protein
VLFRCNTQKNGLLPQKFKNLGEQMDIRLTGTEEECKIATEKIAQLFTVLEQSNFYPNRGNSKLGRIYLKVKAS